MSCYFAVSVNSMTTWSMLKLPKIAWSSPFKLTCGVDCVRPLWFHAIGYLKCYSTIEQTVEKNIKCTDAINCNYIIQRWTFFDGRPNLWFFKNSRPIFYSNGYIFLTRVYINWENSARFKQWTELNNAHWR